jgi:hypothetical protein
MFSFLVPIVMEFFKYQSGQAIREKFQMTQEQIQKTIQEQVTKILIKFFGGLFCTVALCYSLIGLLDLLQKYINTLVYATEIKIVFFVLVLAAAGFGLKAIFVDEKLDIVKPSPQPPPPQSQPDFNIIQSMIGQFVEGLNEGMKDSRKKKPSDHQN